MGLASDILRKASVILLDEDHIRWPLSELNDWLNDGIKATILAKPSASSTTIAIQLREGTLQEVPTDTDPVPLSLVRLVRNLKSERLHQSLLRA